MTEGGDRLLFAASACAFAAPAPARRSCSCTAPTACRSGCRCSICCPSSSRCSCPSIPASAARTTRRGCATSATSRCTTSISSTSSGPTGPCRRPVARRLGRGRSGGPQLLAASKGCRCSAPAGIRIKGMPSGDNFIWVARGSASATSTTTRRIADQHPGAAADRRAGRHRC